MQGRGHNRVVAVRYELNDLPVLEEQMWKKHPRDS